MKNKLLTILILISLTGGLGSTTAYANERLLNDRVICQNAYERDEVIGYDIVNNDEITNEKEDLEIKEVSFIDKVASFWNNVIEFFGRILNSDNIVKDGLENNYEEKYTNEILEDKILDSEKISDDFNNQSENIFDTNETIQENKVEFKENVVELEQKKDYDNKENKFEVQETIDKKSESLQENVVNLQQSQSGQSKAFLAQVEQSIFNKVNEERRKSGLPELKYDSVMENYARKKSQDMGDENYFSHTDLNGGLISDKMKTDGVSFLSWGENIAYISGVSDSEALAKQFMNNWMNSEGHKQNILSGNYTNIGIGVYKIGNKVYATQEFKK